MAVINQPERKLAKLTSVQCRNVSFYPDFFSFNLECIFTKKITHDLNHDLIFYCGYNPLWLSVFRVLGIYNFGLREKEMPLAIAFAVAIL